MDKESNHSASGYAMRHAKRHAKRIAMRHAIVLSCLVFNCLVCSTAAGNVENSWSSHARA